MQLLTIFDFLLLPVYFILFYVLALRAAKKQPSEVLKKYYIRSFLLHMFGSVLLIMIIQYYYGAGDSFTYYIGGEFIRKAGHETGRTLEMFFMSGKNLFEMSQTYEMDEIPRYGMQTTATLAMQKITGALSFVSFHGIIVIGLFMSRFAFLGQWKLFMVLNERLGERNQRLLAFAVLFLPSVWFWGSGLGKDAICMGALGYLCHAGYLMFIKRIYSVRNIVVFIISLLTLYIIKSYIAAAFIAAAGAGLFIGIIKSGKTRFTRVITGLFLSTLLVFMMSFFLISYIQNVIEESAKSIEVFSATYANSEMEDERSKGSFDPGEFDISLSGFVAKSPEKIFSTLFRPFIWETRKPIMLFSALESLAMLFCFIYLVFLCRIIRFFGYIFSDGFLMFAFIFCMVLAVIIGFTTFNFGTLVRYRLPLLPFFGFLLISIYSKAKERKKNKPLMVPAS